MSKPTTTQKQIFTEINSTINRFLGNGESIEVRNDIRLAILEECSAAIGGFSVDEYICATPWTRITTQTDAPIKKIVELINQLPIHPSVCLSILSVDDLTVYDQKSTGAYYTDFRLAKLLTDPLSIDLAEFKGIPKVIDLAVGSAILLTTLASTLSCKKRLDLFLSYGLYGCDISETALRGSCLSLSSLTNDIAVITLLTNNLIQGDSLVQAEEFWEGLAPEGFDFVIGNPPWEKLKAGVHEYFKSQGHQRHYGQLTVSEEIPSKLVLERLRLKDYAGQVRNLIPDMKGEVDLYMPFLCLSYSLVKIGGTVSQIVPASLIRTQNAEPIRNSIIENSEKIEISILDNKSKFFAIDSRFKFLIINSIRGNNCDSINIKYTKSSRYKIDLQKGVLIDTKKLKAIRPDFSLPEIRNEREWSLFYKISDNHVRFGDKVGLWDHVYYRELDMTLDKRLFSKQKLNNSIPLIEGRMVHQFVFGAKSYVSGSGRKAIWEESYAANARELLPQFYADKSAFSKILSVRSLKNRVGFCDVTGQTNERTMLASVIPKGSVCGNKVPTIDFLNEETWPDIPYVWMAIANSFVYDWLLRRVITTNANFFIVDSIPIPRYDPNSNRQSKIADLAKTALKFSKNGFTWDAARIRAHLDALVAEEYGISYKEYNLILKDFNSIDRLQPSIGFETKCTLTKDLALTYYLKLLDPFHVDIPEMESRLIAYNLAGAIPYMPSQFKGQLVLS